VEVAFRTRKLEREYLKSAVAIKAYGAQVARKYIQRVNIIKHARNIEELTSLPGLRCHPLKGNRYGQFAVNLTGFYRLIFTLHGDELEIAKIEEVSKHYDD
jgi:proteic killer suppression protein